VGVNKIAHWVLNDLDASLAMLLVAVVIGVSMTAWIRLTAYIFNLLDNLMQ
jgi:hypothetical protein